VFDQSFQRWLAATFPDLVARTNTSLPLWWPVAGAPAIAALGAATGRRGLAALGTAWSLLNTYLGADVARSEIVPGANDNLSGVAVLVALAERLREELPPGVRVVLASCGAEEVVQGGIYAFAERHFPGLARDRTAVLNLDSVGSPYLVMLEGEGTFVMEDYTDPAFRDLVEEAAAAAGVRMARGARARSSTDAVIPSRAGFPTTTLTSLEPGTKLISNYHLPTDTPENLDYGTVTDAARVAEEVARRLSAAA
jgi:Zn-dependent M28 family amino/carboxypeptidase